MTAEKQVSAAIWRRTLFMPRLGLMGQYLLMILLLLYTTIPLIWMYGAAFRPVTEIFKYVYPLTWKTFVPVNFTAQKFVEILFTEGTYWPRYIFNSLFVAVTTVVVGGFVNALAAYAFARLRFPGREFLFLFVLSTIIIPFEAIALPLFLVVKQLGWLNSYQALIVPALANAFTIFLLRQFFQGIPSALVEAATIDGASPLRIFFQIIVPLSWPAIISAGLITFQASWNAFIWPLIATSSPELRVISLGIGNLVGVDAVYWDELFAAVALSATVPLLIFFVLQRFYRIGIATTGIKG